jgi:hypothetical protein
MQGYRVFAWVTARRAEAGKPQSCGRMIDRKNDAEFKLRKD